MRFFPVLARLLLGALIPVSIFADEVVLKDGSRVVGEVLELSGGKLKVRTSFAKEIDIDWPEVAALTTEKPLHFALSNRTVLRGTSAPGEPGRLAITVDAAPVAVPLSDITAITAQERPYMTFKGFATVGATINDGNTQNRAFYANAELETRTELWRFTLRGATNYAQDTSGITARNSRGSAKYDLFFTRRLYGFASALFEGDKFQDLKLRTALSAGPGYQFIDSGDLSQPWLRELQLSGEAGLSYFHEDFKSSPDREYLAARWAAKVNWPVLPKKVVLFHNHEGYPSLERGDDLYITTEQGVRFAFLENFFAAAQVNWRWDNTPAAGRERSDTTYLFSLGYNFSFAR